ncbi:indolepyruvate ferredoxin oxidoreductase subunit alpha [Maridesulfovibrio bastinii]|jgi:2-oxoglutarate ferredoxin oxidoreductase subunit delta|uniref:indolepyruvate ferredoxin oxidoreductase subunit alpha n=1 Tax=Maridesulfovibrio bastinii TaxID=47157 RepID=UPI00040FF538|nr:4Fe-4S dicluster domain-containing protein [Maridesulfovibrio bastinii]
MSRIEVLEEQCKGCLLCTTVCPKEIIRQSERFNHHGYKVAEVPAEDMEKCIGCSSCAMMCPDIAIRVYRTVKPKGETKDA